MNNATFGDSSSLTLEENLKKALTELLILHLLSEQDRYIGELTSLIAARSNGILNIVFPYAAIYRLQQAGYLSSSGKRSAPDGRRREYFHITKPGLDYLKQLVNIYFRFSSGVADILDGGIRNE